MTRSCGGEASRAVRLFGVSLLLAAAAGFAVTARAAAPALSRWVWSGPDGWLLYLSTALGDRIPDFSSAGYRGGGVPLPDVVFLVSADRVVTVAPGSADDGPTIQAAIDRVSALPPEQHGSRGVVQLLAGGYRTAGQLRIAASGVVLRGAGTGKGGTTLRAAGTDRRTLIAVGPASGQRSKLPGTEHAIVDSYVPVGASSFRVNGTAGLVPGTRVVVQRPSTAAWIHDIGMDRIPGSETVQWAAGGEDLLLDRTVTRIEDDRVFIDAPVVCALDRRYGGGTVWAYEFPERIENVGIEHLEGVSDFSGLFDEDHAWSFIAIDRTENAWVRDVTARYFAWAAVDIEPLAAHVTVEDTRNLDPISHIEGGRRYSFNVTGQMNLLHDVHTRLGRHDFVQGPLACGPNVFLDASAQYALDESGPHQRWSVGTLFDGVTIDGDALAAWDRGSTGDSQGWSGANIVFWNCSAAALRVQNPPTAQSWVIGCSGSVELPNDFLHAPVAIYDSFLQRVSLGDPAHNPKGSLYLAQLAERLTVPGAQRREYVLGDYDLFAPDGPNGDEVPIAPGWRAEVQRWAAANGAALGGFDTAHDGHIVPFSFVFRLEPGEQAVAATLTAALKKPGGVGSDDGIWLQTMDDGHRVLLHDFTVDFTQAPLGQSIILVLPLTGEQLGALQMGTLNAAIGTGIAVDWVRLDLMVAPPRVRRHLR